MKAIIITLEQSTSGEKYSILMLLVSHQKKSPKDMNIDFLKALWQ